MIETTKPCFPGCRNGSSPTPGEVGPPGPGPQTLLVAAIVVAGALMVFDGSYGLITGK